MLQRDKRILPSSFFTSLESLVSLTSDYVELLLTGQVDELNCISTDTDCEVLILFLLWMFHGIHQLVYAKYVDIQVMSTLVKVTIHHANQSLGTLGNSIAGILGGVFSTPCSTPILIVLLAIVAGKGSALWGTLLLFLYSVGHGALAVAAGTSVGFVRKLSRSEAKQLVEDGRVFINSRLTVDPSVELREGALVSARGYGRFRFDGAAAETRKGRLRVVLRIY